MLYAAIGFLPDPVVRSATYLLKTGSFGIPSLHAAVNPGDRQVSGCVHDS